jgi:hypothetical protein
LQSHLSLGFLAWHYARQERGEWTLQFNLEKMVRQELRGAHGKNMRTAWNPSASRNLPHDSLHKIERGDPGKTVH